MEGIVPSFGFSVQAKVKQVTDENNQFKTRVNRTGKDLLIGKLIDFNLVQVESGDTFNVNALSQSVRGLSKYFRKVNNIYFVEKPSEKPRVPIANCFKFRRGAMIEGFITDDNEFFIKDYANI